MGKKGDELYNPTARKLEKGFGDYDRGHWNYHLVLEVGEERHIYFDQELQLVYLLGTAHLSRTGKNCETDEDFCMTLPLEVHPGYITWQPFINQSSFPQMSMWTNTHKRFISLGSVLIKCSQSKINSLSKWQACCLSKVLQQ